MKWLIGILGAVLVVVGLMWGVQQLGNAASDVATSLPPKADAATLTSDLHMLKINVATAAVEAGGELPTVAIRSSSYVITGADGVEVTQPTNVSATSVQLTGTSLDSFCVSIEAADGTTLHIADQGGAEEGPCP